MVNDHAHFIAGWWKASRIFLLCGAVIGLGLRFYFVKPLPIRFSYWLHAHSHVMLLGWVYNALLLLVYQRFFLPVSRLEKTGIVLLQVAVLGMLGSFPVQGYGPVAIVFSSLHLVVADLLAVGLWIRSRGIAEAARLPIRLAMGFQWLSSLGPFLLGYLSARTNLTAQGIAHTAWNQLAIFFYLHCLYNGVFFYLMLALWLPLSRISKFSFYGMAMGTVLTFAHAVLFVDERPLWSVVAVIGSVMQLAVWLTWIKNGWDEMKDKAGILLLLALSLKLFLQIAGSFPPLSHLVITQRFWLMAYLHFLFLGIFTPFVWVLAGVRRRFLAYGWYWLMWAFTEGLLLAPYLFRHEAILPVVWYTCLFAGYAGLAGFLVGTTFGINLTVRPA